MAFDKHTWLLFAAAAVLRLLLFTFFPSLPGFLAARVEVSTPVTSFKRLQEGLFLYTHNVSPYDGGVYHQAPLFLPLFSLLPDPQSKPFFTNMVYILADIFGAGALLKLSESGEAVSSRLFTSTRRNLRWAPSAVAAAFLFNPFTITTCIARSTSVFTNTAILQALTAATTGNIPKSIFALAIAAYLSLYPLLLIPALALLTFDRVNRSGSKSTSAPSFLVWYATATVGATGLLLVISYCVMDFSWEFLASTYGVQLTLSDLMPNVGLWWYFFIEMFDSFRDFFLAVFWLHMASYAGGVTIRLRTQPLFVATTILGIFAIFKPYPSIADTALYLSLLPLYRHVFPLLRYGFIAAAAILYATFLGPAFYHLWIYAGSGNANFFYAITLVWSLGLIVIVADSIFAVLRDEFEVERPEMKDQDVRQI